MPTYTLTATQLNNRILNSFVITAGSSVPTVSDPNAQAFLDAAVITDVTQANAVNSLVIGLKADGLWSNMQALYPFVGGTANQHKYNLKDPRDLDAAYRIGFSGGWTHNANGAIGNGINTYADTYYTYFSQGEIGVYNRGGVLYFGSRYQEWEGGDFPVYGLPEINMTCNNVSNYFIFSNNIDGSNVFYVSGTNIHLGLNTLVGNSSNVSLYRNGSLITSSANPSAPNALITNIWLGGINSNEVANNPVYGNSQLAFGFITTTVLNATQNTNLYNRIQTFQTALSRNV